MTAARSKAYFAAIDLGSNSFHMLVVRVVAGGVQVVSKIKRKVRLAAGLNSDGQLDDAAKARALECLRIFADRVQDIDSTHIRAVGTATLRKVRHDQAFLDQCQRVLGHPIEVISGDEEAATIYQGIAHTTAFNEQMLIIDIGGASTELVLGQGFTAQVLNSLDMGCVTWYSQFFAGDHGRITETNTAQAIAAAEACCNQVTEQYQDADKALVLGASGTFKALQEIAAYQGLNPPFTQAWLNSVLQQCIRCGDHSTLHIDGLKEARKHVFVSGLCILLGVCKSLKLPQLQPTSGALREGVIYGLLAGQQTLAHQQDVQQRTLDAVAATYHLDTEQAQRVLHLAGSFYQQLHSHWAFPNNTPELIRAVAYLHELGLSLAYKQASAHATYMVQHLDMPGFAEPVRKQITDLLAATAGIIDDESEPSLDALEGQPMRHLARLLRLAMMLCQRRTDASIPNYQLHADQQHLFIQAPIGFWQQNPFLHSLLQNEQRGLSAAEQLTFAPLA